MDPDALRKEIPSLGTSLGEALLAPTKIYVKALKMIRKAGADVHACSHITGGGFYENVPRMLPEGLCAVIDKASFPVLPVFTLLQEQGGIEEKEDQNVCGTSCKG